MIVCLYLPFINKKLKYLIITFISKRKNIFTKKSYLIIINFIKVLIKIMSSHYLPILVIKKICPR